MAPPLPMSGPRYNEFIQAPKVRVIDENGENLGVMYTREAFEQAHNLSGLITVLGFLAAFMLTKLSAS